MLRVFEAFAGYGSQRMALKNIGVEHKVVGISEIDGDAILSYAAIHEELGRYSQKNEYEIFRIWEELETINVPLDYKTFENRARKLKGKKLQDMYLANKLSRNYGDIRRIDPGKLPDFDFFTYSFPCQDISVAGYQRGLLADSGTRSSLLWECCKIIEVKRPKYLMMENVKNLIGKNHKDDFESFLKYLESLGYTNHWKVLNARDFGIPQNRERVFCVSILDCDNKFTFPDSLELKKNTSSLLEEFVDEKFYLKNNQVSDEEIRPKYIYCLDANYWKGTFLKDYLAKRRRQVVTDGLTECGKYRVRRLTPLETWRFMGVSDIDFYKAEKFVSNTNLYRQSGNSIAVPVMEHIFKNLFLKSGE
ncbi:MAG: DNA cytosine methyltransferase [Culicoidibacterales bacterium]